SCKNGNKVIRVLHSNDLTINKMPLIHYALFKKNYSALKEILESKMVDHLLRCTMKETNQPEKTPLEYAKNDKEACNLILGVLSKNNPFANAIIHKNHKAL